MKIWVIFVFTKILVVSRRIWFISSPKYYVNLWEENTSLFLIVIGIIIIIVCFLYFFLFLLFWDFFCIHFLLNYLSEIGILSNSRISTALFWLCFSQIGIEFVVIFLVAFLRFIEYFRDVLKIFFKCKLFKYHKEKWELCFFQHL